MRTIYISMVLLMLSACDPQENATDWRLHYESQYKAPYGTYVLSQELEYIYPNSTTEVIKERTSDHLQSYDEYEYSSYIYINELFYPDSLTQVRLLNFTQYENSLFIATRNFDAPLFKPYKIETASTNVNTAKLKLNYASENGRSYTIDNKVKQLSYFTSVPNGARVLGTIEVNGIAEPNFIELGINDADQKILLHSNPLFFTNYHMLHSTDGQYAVQAMAQLNHTSYFLWDGYGTERRYTTPPQDGSIWDTLSYILKHKSLAAALFTFIAAILLLFGVNYKRISRNIPIYSRPQNNSLAFMKMVSNLFMHEENHIDLARYRVNYLLDRIRQRYNVSTAEITHDFKVKLAQKANINPKELDVLIAQFQKVKTLKQMSKEGFLSFSKLIETHIQKLDIYHGTRK